MNRANIEAVLGQLTPGSKTGVRLELMHWTGMRPSQMGRLTRANFHLEEPIPYVSVPRGKRGRLAAVPLVDEAVVVARVFIESEAFGAWSTPSANKAIRTAARKADLEPFTVYQISPLVRHVAPARGGRPRGHPGLVRAHRLDDDEDLRGADTRQAAGRDPAAACRDRPMKTRGLSVARSARRTTIGTW